MTGPTRELSDDTRFLIFQALSHPARVKILILIEENELTFSSLKHELGFESSGQLQHHLQKLSDFITERQSGCYVLTDTGRRALEIYRESEKSGRSLGDVCCIPVARQMTKDKQVGRTGILIRISIAVVLLALTTVILIGFLAPGQMGLSLQLYGSNVSFGIDGAIVSGFFGVSFLISAITGFPGCEITAIPNLFGERKRYCGCLITPFNLPNGSLLRRNTKPD